MPLIRINAQAGAPVLHSDPRISDLTSVMHQRDPLGHGPVIVMIHGFKYRPGHPTACPHKNLFSKTAGISSGWPRAMGFGLMGQGEGLGVAFGWDARGSLFAAHQKSKPAGAALVALIAQIRAVWPKRAIHVISHSMGSEVLCEALHHLPAHSISRVILMTAASFRKRVDAALAAPAGRTLEVINITSRENDLFDFLYERVMSSLSAPDLTVGTGLNGPNSVTLQLDCPVTLDHLARLGRPIDAPRRRICHWSSYARRGTLRLYADLLRYPERFPLELLRQGLPPKPTPRWSRLMAVWPAIQPVASS